MGVVVGVGIEGSMSRAVSRGVLGVRGVRGVCDDDGCKVCDDDCKVCDVVCVVVCEGVCERGVSEAFGRGGVRDG